MSILFKKLTYHLVLNHPLLSLHHFKINIRKQKGEKITIWERNFQLAFYSIMLLCIVLVYEIQMAEVSLPLGVAVPQRFFKGWTSNTVMISLIQAVRTCVHTRIHMNMKKC